MVNGVMKVMNRQVHRRLASNNQTLKSVVPHTVAEIAARTGSESVTILYTVCIMYIRSDVFVFKV